MQISTVRLLKIGEKMFFTGIGISGMVNYFIKDLALTWPRPLPEPVQNANPVMAYLAGFLLISSAIIGIQGKLKTHAAFAIAAIILLLLVPRHMLNYWRDYINGFKSLALLSGCLLIAYRPEHHSKIIRRLFNVASLCFALFFLCCGYTHFKIAGFVKTLIPGYIPFKLFFTYFTGACLLLAAVGLVIPGRIRKLAALLSGIMITGWLFLLHLPKAVLSHQNYGEWTSVAESMALAGICFILYGTAITISDRNATGYLLKEPALH